MRLWRVRSPTIGHLQAVNPGKPVVYFQGLGTGEPMVDTPVQVWKPENQDRWGKEKTDVKGDH